MINVRKKVLLIQTLAISHKIMVKSPEMLSSVFIIDRSNNWFIDHVVTKCSLSLFMSQMLESHDHICTL